MTDELLTVTQVAEELRVSYFSVARALRKGLLPGVKHGNQWRVRRADLFVALKDYADRGAPIFREDLQHQTLQGKPRRFRPALIPRPRGEEWWATYRKGAAMSK
jgi:excisionase family DNA binding protein